MAKPLTLVEIRHRCARFVADWRGSEGYERGEAHDFMRELLGAYGISGRRAASYEKRVTRASTGREGFIDALVPGLAVIEMKGRGKDLDPAEAQALDYVQSLPDPEQPRFVITSNFDEIRVLDIEAHGDEDAARFPLDDLPRNAEALAFLAGYQTRRFGNEQQRKASIKAAQLMASLYEQVEKAGLSDHETSIFLVRTLFCLYADDAGLWERDLFTQFLEDRTSPDGSDLGAQLSMLFQVLDQPQERRPASLDELTARFPYVNGGVFGESLHIPVFGGSTWQRLHECCDFNWSGISPAIFGSLFQSVKSQEARRALGEHYTTETNIEKALGPLFLDELHEKFTERAHDVAGLKRLLADIGEMRVLDPACGCGNFLVVAYRDLRALELAILERLQQLQPERRQTDLFAENLIGVKMSHFAGIEIEEWPARIATTALYLVRHQANQRMEITLGRAPNPLPLVANDCINVGNALRTDWARIFPPTRHTRVVGNPPFVGHKTKTPSQVADLEQVWGGLYDGYLDYVTGWYKKAIDYFGEIAGRFAFVSTNSIAQGLPVAPLFEPIFHAGWRIRFAHQTFPWTSEAPGEAQVHCVIVGFDRDRSSRRAELFGYRSHEPGPRRVPVSHINAYLTDGPDIVVGKRSTPLSQSLPPVAFGYMPGDGGNLLLDSGAYAEATQDKHAAPYVRRFVGARELIHDTPRWCLWMLDLDPKDVSRSNFLRQRINGCRSFRESSRRATTRRAAATSQSFMEIRQPRTSYVCIPAHFSEKRRYATVQRLGPDVICGNANFTAQDPDGFLFAIISSAMFLTWQRAVGGRIKSDYRFSASIVWNNLPLPPIDEHQRQAIIDAGKGVLAARALHPERSLADHYNPFAMDPELLKAHRTLDHLVDRAFRCTVKNPTEEDRRAALFARYAQLTTTGARRQR